MIFGPKLEAWGIGALVFTVVLGATAIAANRKGHASEKAVWEGIVATLRAEAAEEQATMAERFRVQEHAWQSQVVEAQNALAAQQDKTRTVEAALRRVRTELDGLRGDIARFAAGAASASEDTLTACRNRATALGGLLEQALQASEECAGDGERESNKTRALRAAWPG